MIQAHITDSVSIELRVPRQMREALAELAHKQKVSVNKLLFDILADYMKGERA